MINYAIDHAEKIFNGHEAGQLINFACLKQHGTKKRPQINEMGRVSTFGRHEKDPNKS